MKVCVLACLFTAIAAAASAQVGATLKIQVYQAPVVGDITIVTPFRESAGIVLAAPDCGKPLFPLAPPAVETNPRQAAWTDPTTSALPAAQQLLCMSAQAAFFAALPARGTATVAGYVSTITVSTSGTDPNTGLPITLTSPRSAAGNPFSLLLPLPLALPAPVGYQVRP